MLRTILSITILGTLSLFASTTHAATFFLTPETGELGIQKDIAVDLKINTEDVGINAGQATLRYPKDILEIKSINTDNSIFNFWLEGPTFSNTNGVISFIGGTPYGVSGSSLQVFHIVFTSRAVGTAPISIVDSAITASDGTGTNVLSKTTDAVFTITPETVSPTPIIPAPIQIIRTPTPTKNLPDKPIINIPLYPDPKAWSGNTGIFTATWDLPETTTGVATAINKQPVYTPTENEGLFDNKTFQSLSDGIWYLHVQFKNNAGWGEVTHYRIAIDTTTPLPFHITSSEDTESDNPAPTFNFKATDALSGITEYRIKVDNSGWTTINSDNFNNTYKLLNQKPGKHELTIQAFDFAGNSIETATKFETLPLPSPTFTTVPEKIYNNDDLGVPLMGTGLPSTKMIVSIEKGGATVSSNTIDVDINGNWSFTFSGSLRNGTYYATIQNKDMRGALSLVVKSSPIQITGKYTAVIISAFAFIVGILLVGILLYLKQHRQTNLRIQIASSDTTKVFKIIEEDIEKLEKAQKTPVMTDDIYITEKLKNNVKKMSNYIKKTIDRTKF